jgi:hypothetical protein
MPSLERCARCSRWRRYDFRPRAWRLARQTVAPARSSGRPARLKGGGRAPRLPAPDRPVIQHDDFAALFGQRIGDAQPRDPRPNDADIAAHILRQRPLLLGIRDFVHPARMRAARIGLHEPKRCNRRAMVAPASVPLLDRPDHRLDVRLRHVIVHHEANAIAVWRIDQNPRFFS